MDQPLEQNPLRILLLEDAPSDAELEESELRDAGLEFTSLRVDTRAAFERALDEFKPDVVIADYRLPNYNGREALEYARRTHPWIPVIMATGAMGDEAAVELLKLGARDYVLKDRLARLAPAIRRTLSEERGIRNRKLAEEKYRALFGEAMDGIVLIDYATAQVADCNPEFERQTGRTLEQLRQMNIIEMLPPSQQGPAQQRMLEVQQTGSGRGAEFTILQPSGKTVPIEFSSKYLNLHGHSFIQAVTRDITARVHADAALRESEERYRRITDGITDYQYTVYIENGHVVRTIQSVACQEVTGYTAEEFAATGDLWLQMVVPEDREAVLERVGQALNGQDVQSFEHRIRRKDGEIRWVNNTIILFKDASGKLQSYDGVVRDVTERVNAERALRESEDKFRTIAGSAQDAILMMDSDGLISYWNAAAENIFGYKVDEALGQCLHVLIAPARFRDDYHRGFAHFRETGEGPVVGKTIELIGLKKGGTEFPLELSLSAIKKNGLWHGIGIIRDITERKQTENALLRANRALKTLSAGNLALVRANSENELLHASTRVIVEQGGYRLAVVDYSENNPEKSITPMAWSGLEESQYWLQPLTWADTELGQLPASRAIRSGTTQVCHDIASDPGFALWKDAARAHGYVSNIALPLFDDGRIFGSLSIYSSEVDAFIEEEVRLLEELAKDLAFGIVTLRARVALQTSEQALIESKKRLDAITTAAQDAIAMIDDSGNVCFWNPAAENLFGYAATEVFGRNMHELIVPERYLDAHRKGFAKFTETGTGPAVGRITELAGITRDGREFPAEISLSSMQIEGRWYGVGIVRDISVRKNAERERDRLTRTVRLLSDCSMSLLRAEDEQIWLSDICRLVVESGGYLAAWIGFPEQNADKSVRPVTEAGQAEGYLEEVRISWDEASEFGHGPTGTAVRTGATQINQNFLTSSSMLPWREAAIKRGYRSSIALPLTSQQQVLGALTIYAPDPDAFSAEEVALLEELAANISFGIVTLRTRVERKQLELQKEQYLRFFMLSSEAMCIADPFGCFKQVNPAMVQLTGYSENELISRPFMDFLYPEDRQKTADEMKLQVGDRPSMQFENRYVCKNGSVIYLSWNAYFDKNDSVTYATARNITESKVAEEQIRKLLLAIEQSPESIVITNLDGNIEYVNESFLRNTGYSREEAIGSNPRILHSGKTPRTTFDDLWHTLTDGQTWHGEFINRRKDGSEYTEIASVTPIRQPDGRISHYVAVKQDVTEKKRLDEELDRHRHHLEELVDIRTHELEAAKRVAEAANAAKSTFVANMSHEIRTPMNGVIGMLDVLQQSSLNDKQIEIVNIIHDSAFSLLSIIDDILDFSKIEAGKLQVENIPMSIAEVIEKACGTLDRMAMKRNVELTLFVDPAIPITVMGDPGRLRQILVNLTNNAVKFSGGQQRIGRVSVRAELVNETPIENDLKNVMVEFRVTDNGIGIDEQTQGRLFTSFTQADSSTTRNYGGTGLGLTITRHLVNLQGGTITLRSKLGQGSIFSVRLPFALSTEPAQVSEVSSLVAGLNCLVVGSVETLARDLAAYLTNAGAKVEQVPDLAAIQAWRAGILEGVCIVVVDNAGFSLQPAEMRSTVRIPSEQETRFVIIGRGQRREPRLDADDLVQVDGNVLGRDTLLRAVAIVAGRANVSEREYQPGNVKSTLAPLSREGARRRGRLILIAEDNEINQKVIMQQLTLLGYTADIASNGREALQRWRSGDYALLFTDLHMPEMDGYELTAAIRADEASGEKTSKRPAPVIAFTANALKGEAEHCIAAGMNDYLSKPVQLINLKAMLEKWMPNSTPPIQAPTTTTIVTPANALVVDVDVLKKLVGDDDAIVRDFLHDFRLSAVKIAAELRTACTAGQTSVAGASAHKLKSSARSVGALALGELCAEMELAGKANNAEALMSLLPKFEQELANVEHFLERY